MKNIIGKLLLFILSITYYCELNAATTFTIDGIVYEVNIDYSKYPYEEDGTCKASMFRGNGNVKDVVIPSRVTYNYKTYTVSTIGNSFAYNQTMIKSVVIPSSVKSINMSAFYGCTSLETLTLPEGLEKIGEYAFGGYWWLPKIKEFPIVFYTENQLLTKSCPNIVSSRGTKMGQNLLKTYLAIFFHDVHVIKDLCYSFAKVHNYCETNEGNPLNLSFAVHFSATCTDNGIFG